MIRCLTSVGNHRPSKSNDLTQLMKMQIIGSRMLPIATILKER